MIISIIYHLFIYLNYLSICLSFCLIFLKVSHHSSLKRFTNNQINVLFCNQFWLFWLYIYLFICLYFFYRFKFCEGQSSFSCEKVFKQPNKCLTYYNQEPSCLSNLKKMKNIGKGIILGFRVESKGKGAPWILFA